MEGVGVSRDAPTSKNLIEELSHEQITEFREAFETFDRDKDGVISVGELTRILKMIGLEIPDRDVREMFDEADQDGSAKMISRQGSNSSSHAPVTAILRPHSTDVSALLSFQQLFLKAEKGGNGTLDFEEFMAMVSKKMTNTDVREDIKEAFKVFDSKGVGFLTTGELREIMMSHGDYSMTEDEINEMLSHADIDGDGLINYEEFVAVLTSTEKKHLSKSKT